MLPKREGVVEGKIRSFGLEDASICIGEGNGNPLQYSCLENPTDGGAWWSAVHGVAEGRTRPSNFTFTFHFHAAEKEMAPHSSVLAWRIPGMGSLVGYSPWGLEESDTTERLHFHFHFPPPGDFPNPGIKHVSLMSPALAGRLFTISATWEAL